MPGERCTPESPIRYGFLDSGRDQDRRAQPVRSFHFTVKASRQFQIKGQEERSWLVVFLTNVSGICSLQLIKFSGDVHPNP